jgi:hypothetical protein
MKIETYLTHIVSGGSICIRRLYDSNVELLCGYSGMFQQLSKEARHERGNLVTIQHSERTIAIQVIVHETICIPI